VLHAHLPFVRHPEHEEFLEEDWLFEAITETYVPLLHVLESLARDGVDFRLTLSMSPTLLAMLRDELLMQRYVQHLDRLVELSECEVRRTRHQPEFATLAEMYRERFLACRRTFVERLRCDLVGGFATLQESGHLEILTSAATHAFLPLMQALPRAAEAQVRIAVEDYARHFGRRPSGIWLPECGYYPGLEVPLAEQDLRCFVLDAHGVVFGEPRPRFGVYAPVRCANGVAAFGRDLESAKQVWSAEEGYPGDARYRDFYRDIGFDLDLDYIRPYIHAGDLRIHTGIKYHAVPGKTAHKQPYSRAAALDAVAQHAHDFLRDRQEQANALHAAMGQPPVIVAPYDAELFGHWWFEGPQFLDVLFRKMHFEGSAVKPLTLIEYLDRHPHLQVQAPTYSSWGYKGYAEVWLEGSNDWIYRHLDHAVRRMTALANAHPRADGHLERALNQAARELLLAQSSDWAFIMKAGTTVPYATQRTKTHVHRFRRLAEMIQAQRVDLDELRRIESIDNLLPGASYRAFASA
jgi:1,4-alpha-glucan branching enzyme